MRKNNIGNSAFKNSLWHKGYAAGYDLKPPIKILSTSKSWLGGWFAGRRDRMTEENTHYCGR